MRQEGQKAARRHPDGIIMMVRRLTTERWTLLPLHGVHLGFAAAGEGTWNSVEVAEKAHEQVEIKSRERTSSEHHDILAGRRAVAI